MLPTLEIGLSPRAENHSWLPKCPDPVRVPNGMSPLPHFRLPIVQLSVIPFQKSQKFNSFRFKKKKIRVHSQAINGYHSGGNNCELSDLDPREFDPVRHLVIDRDADIYERSLVGRNCRDTPVTTWNNRPTIKPTSSSREWLITYNPRSCYSTRFSFGYY